MKKQGNETIAIIGLGYVGLPLAIEFGKIYPTIGFDIDSNRIEQLQNYFDKNNQVVKLDFTRASLLCFSNNPASISNAQIFIITVPTPVDTYKTPDISALLQASILVGNMLKKGDIVIYESTTYPTCTQTNCVPILENTSKLVYNQDFFVGYSPERINPGDKQHTLTTIKKITSASTPKAAKQVDALYQSIIQAGTYMAPSIEIAEAAKVIENAQRDLNVAFVNELAIIFDKLGIDTHEVLQAAKSKWNFLNFSPGLVGGHCIGVDPYYLTHIASKLGYHPKIISAGRQINDAMPSFIAQKMLKLLAKNNIEILGAKLLLLGISFKENCKDVRNSKVPIVKSELEEFGCLVEIFDPIVDKNEAKKTYGFEVLDFEGVNKSVKNRLYDGVILCVPHRIFKEFDPVIVSVENSIILDLKGFFPYNIAIRL